MCLAVPAKVIEIDGDMAVVESEGVRREGNIVFVPDAEVGDYVLIHAGFAIKKWTEEDAREFDEIMRDVKQESDAEGNY